MYGLRIYQQVAGHIRPLITSNIATRRAAEPINPLGEGQDERALLPNACIMLV